MEQFNIDQILNRTERFRLNNEIDTTEERLRDIPDANQEDEDHFRRLMYII